VRVLEPELRLQRVVGEIPALKPALSLSFPDVCQKSAGQIPIETELAKW
jgi:hypothetical protein